MLALGTLQGAALTDPVFAHPDGTPVDTRTLADAITAARPDTGLVVTRIQEATERRPER